MKKIIYSLIILLVLIQFYHPAKNINAAVPSETISAFMPTNDSVQTILNKACADCHSGNTRYPWYNTIQPVASWLNSHITEGKEELNFDKFATYTPRRQYNKLQHIIEEVKEGEMPLGSYTIIHKDAILTDAEKNTIENWAQTGMEMLKTKYPMDSLVKKKE